MNGEENRRKRGPSPSPVSEGSDQKRFKGKDGKKVPITAAEGVKCPEGYTWNYLLCIAIFFANWPAYWCEVSEDVIDSIANSDLVAELRGSVRDIRDALARIADEPEEFHLYEYISGLVSMKNIDPREEVANLHPDCGIDPLVWQHQFIPNINPTAIESFLDTLASKINDHVKAEAEEDEDNGIVGDSDYDQCDDDDDDDDDDDE